MNTILMMVLAGLAIIHTFKVSMSKQCLCGEVLEQKDCLKGGCQWDFDAFECMEAKCAYYTVQSQCDSRMDCGWKDNACGDFTKCSDYKVNTKEQCYYKGSSTQACQPPTVSSSGQYYCDDYVTPDKVYVPQCTNITIADQCNGNEYDGSFCEWSKSKQKCISFLFNECDDASPLDETYCAKESCIWDSLFKTCDDLECSDIKVESDCVDIPAVDRQSYLICQWVLGKCINYENPELMDKTICQTISLGTYRWNDVKQKCEECVGYTTIISGFILIIMIILI